MERIEDAPVGGRIGPRADGVDAPYWEALHAGEFRMQRCSKCRTWWWSPVWRCGECGSWDLDWEETPAEGRVFSWIRTFQDFSPDMHRAVPYVTVFVELPEAGNRRVFGLLVGSELGLEINAPVVGVLQPASAVTHGQAIMRWRLANNTDVKGDA